MFLQEEPHSHNKVFRLKVTTQAVDTVGDKSGASGKARASGVVKIEGLSRPKWEAPALKPEN